MNTPPVFTALCLVALAVGCMSSDPAPGGGGTFLCPSTGSLTCSYNTQYCQLTVQGGATTPSCVSVPSACAGAGSPCSCITAMYDGGSTSCGSFNVNNLRATTVTLNR